MKTATPLPDDSHWLDNLIGWLMTIAGIGVVTGIASAVVYNVSHVRHTQEIADTTGCGSLITILVSFSLAFGLAVLVREKFYHVQPHKTWAFFLLNEENQIVEAKPGLYWNEKYANLMAVSRVMTMTEHGAHMGSSLIYYRTFQIQLVGDVTRETAVAFYNWYREIRRNRGNYIGMDQLLEASYARTDLPFKVSAVVAPAAT